MGSVLSCLCYDTEARGEKLPNNTEKAPANVNGSGVPSSGGGDTSRRADASQRSSLPLEVQEGTALRSFSYPEMRVATRNFRQESKLGEGGFGSVYRGWVDDGPGKATGRLVAVKQLNREGLQGHKEWLAEVNYLGMLHHPNLVRLIGYCAEDDQRLLVYEFMPRGSLEPLLFKRGTAPLPWTTRMKIALGAAKGLAYLHEEAQTPVIYRDFKTSNILLDQDFKAKLSDFGLARDGPAGEQTHVSTRVMGTYGYAAPEYVMTGHLTAKSDVYGFGVVLLEMLTGRRSMDRNRPTGEHNLVEWARQFLGDKRRLDRLIDPRLEGQFSIRGAQRASRLASHCLNRDPKSRPMMSDVVETLRPLQELDDMAAAAPQGNGQLGSGSSLGSGAPYSGPGNSGPPHSGSKSLPGNGTPGPRV